MQVQSFCFSPFSENTYVVYTAQKRGMIVDPGCYFPQEEQELQNWIAQQGITIDAIVLTHTHLDHVFGLKFVKTVYAVPIFAHPLAPQGIALMPQVSAMYGIPSKPAPNPDFYLEHGQEFLLDNAPFEVRHTPGHAPDHLVLVNHAEKFVINGDVLFNGSVGRADLPGGDFKILEQSIRNQLYTLPDDYTVYCGHGPETTIAVEKRSNPFVKA